MPQLDHISFLSQYVWLCIILGSLYHLFIQDGLTLIAAFLKSRVLLINTINTTSSSDESEQTYFLNFQNTRLKRNQLFLSSFDSTFSFFKDYFVISSLWSKNAKKYTNRIFFMIIDIVFFTFFNAMSFVYIRNLSLLTSFGKSHWVNNSLKIFVPFNVNGNYYFMKKSQFKL
jgi:hypothetical protein